MTGQKEEEQSSLQSSTKEEEEEEVSGLDAIKSAVINFFAFLPKMESNTNTEENETSSNDWRPRSPPSWQAQNSESSLSVDNVNIDGDEGMSLDISLSSSTGLSLTEIDDGHGDQEVLDSNELWNTMNGEEKDYQNSGPHKIEVENVNGLPGLMQRDISNTSMGSVISNHSGISSSSDIVVKYPKYPVVSPEAHPNPKYPVVSPDSSKSKDSTDDLLPQNQGRKTPKKIRFSPVNKVHHFTPSPDEFIENPTQIQIRQSTCGGTARLFFVVYALPFMYGASSNITTLYLLIELMLGYEMSGVVVGTYLTLAYISRVTFASLNRLAPKSCVFFGSVVALMGFALVYASQSTILLNAWGMQDGGLTIFIVGSILSNTNESLSAMQVFVRDQLMHNIKETGQKLKRHYLIAKIARIVSFGVGGFLYQYYGVVGLAALGALMVSLQILCLIIFFVLDNFRQVIDQTQSSWGEIAPPQKLAIDCSIRAAIGRRRLFSSSMSKLNRTLSKYYPPNVPSSILRTSLPLCVFGRTISSIIVWNIAALIMEDDFGKDYVVIGGVFAGMMICDFLATSISMTEKWYNFLIEKLRPPIDVYVFMSGLTISLGLIAVPNFIAFVVGLAIFVFFNSALRTMLYGLQGSSSCGWETFHYQIIRRFFTAVALFCLPMINNLHRKLPLVLAIWIALCTTTVLVVFTQCHRFVQDDDIEKNKKVSTDSFYNARTRPSRRPEKNLVYSERIMLSRLIKGKDV